MLSPEVLIISSSLDYSSDHIAFQLEARGASYLRLNRDAFSEMKLCLDPSAAILEGTVGDVEFRVSERKLRSVYFRAPVFLRDSYQPDLAMDEQFSRSQWAAFLRAFTVFENPRWMNHPAATYQAEVKPYQLRKATQFGFVIPTTRVTNDPRKLPEMDTLAIKTLDTVILKKGHHEGFIYTQIAPRTDVVSSSISSAPVLAQDGLLEKIDIRVTVIDSEVFAVAITDTDGVGIRGDWRAEKDRVAHSVHELPSRVEDGCRRLVLGLGLRFAGIDLMLCDGLYFFVEVNPTGEWAWLMGATGVALDEKIAHALLEN